MIMDAKHYALLTHAELCHLTHHLAPQAGQRFANSELAVLQQTTNWRGDLQQMFGFDVAGANTVLDWGHDHESISGSGIHYIGVEPSSLSGITWQCRYNCLHAVAVDDENFLLILPLDGYGLPSKKAILELGQQVSEQEASQLLVQAVQRILSDYIGISGETGLRTAMANIATGGDGNWADWYLFNFSNVFGFCTKAQRSYIFDKLRRRERWLNIACGLLRKAPCDTRDDYRAALKAIRAQLGLNDYDVARVTDRVTPPTEMCAAA